jgi:hypothetical protein
MVGLPIAVKTMVEKWNKASISEFPAINAWVGTEKMGYFIPSSLWKIRERVLHRGGVDFKLIIQLVNSF